MSRGELDLLDSTFAVLRDQKCPGLFTRNSPGHQAP